MNKKSIKTTVLLFFVCLGVSIAAFAQNNINVVTTAVPF